MYGKPSYLETSKLRLDMFKTRYEVKSTNKSFSIDRRINLSLLLPCLLSLRLHCSRVNYQACIWQHSHHADVYGCRNMMDDGQWRFVHWMEMWRCAPTVTLGWPGINRYRPSTPSSSPHQENEYHPYENEIEEDEIHNIIETILIASHTITGQHWFCFATNPRWP